MAVAALALAYHSVSRGWSHDLAVPPECFRAQMVLLRDRGFRGVPFSDLAEPAAGRRVAVTFDDGFRSVAEEAAPVLAELGWPATVFVVTDATDAAAPVTWIAGAEKVEHRAGLSWDDLAGLAAAGWEVGSHGATHRLLSSLGDAALREELERSRAAVAERFDGCASISYPWGEVDARVVAAARDTGYRAGSGLAGRFTRADPMRIPRFAVGRADGRFRFALKTSEAVKLLRCSRAWPLIERARPRKEAIGGRDGSMFVRAEP